MHRSSTRCRSTEARRAELRLKDLRTYMAGHLTANTWSIPVSEMMSLTSTRFQLQEALETNLTNAKGLDDGPEFTPDGRYIYFNSTRSGTMQIWRMKPDGSDQEQVTNDEYNNWFPHISPDGRWIVFLSFLKDVSPTDHPFYKHVYIRLMPVDTMKPKVIAYVYGGQGTINVPRGRRMESE